MNKKGIEPIIATVLLIVIVIAAAAIVWTVVIPFIKNQMTEGQACVNTVGLSIDTTWTCWNTEKTASKPYNYLQVKIVRDSKAFELKELVLKVTDDEGTTKTVNLKEKFPEIDLIGPLEEQVYEVKETDFGFGASWDGKIISVAVAPVIISGNSEKTCDATATIDVENCAIGM